MQRTELENIELAEKIRAYAKKHESTYAELFRKFGLKHAITLTRIRSIMQDKCWTPIKLPKGNWKYIVLGDNEYYVSDEGRAWSISRNKEVGGKHRGYKVIGVIVDGSVHNFKMSRLVLELFDRPPEPGEVARHLNDDRWNNRLDNLAWGSQYENSDDALANGKSPVGSRGGQSKLTEKQVHDLFFNYDKSIHGGVKAYARELIAKGLPVSEAAIVRIFRGQTWSHVTKLRRRHILGDTKPLDMKAALAIHHNWNKSDLTLREFCSMFSKFLAAKDYGGITPDTIKRVISGKRFPRAQFEYYR